MILLKPNSLFHQNTDRFLALLVQLLAASAAVVLVLIVGFMVHEAWPAWHQIGMVRFLRDSVWFPASPQGTANYGLLPILTGSLLSGCGAVLLAAPLGLGSALFSTLYGPQWLRGIYRQLLQLMSAIPSVVVGFWGLAVLTPLLRQWQPPGQSLMAAIICLAMMVLPTTALLSEQACLAVPRTQLQAAASLGLSRRATLEGVIWPIARKGLLSAVLLACGRALGETMAVLMVAGNVIQYPTSVFDPIRTLTANIALELGYALNLHRSALFVGGLILMAMVAMVMALAALLETRSREA